MSQSVPHLCDTGAVAILVDPAQFLGEVLNGVVKAAVEKFVWFLRHLTPPKPLSHQTHEVGMTAWYLDNSSTAWKYLNNNNHNNNNNNNNHNNNYTATLYHNVKYTYLWKVISEKQEQHCDIWTIQKDILRQMGYLTDNTFIKGTNSGFVFISFWR